MLTCELFFSGKNIQHVIVPCQRKIQLQRSHTAKIEGKGHVWQHRYIECRIIVYYVIKAYTTDGDSVYMCHKGSHSSEVYWFREKLEWGKGKIMILWFGWIHNAFPHNMCILFNLSEEISCCLNIDDYVCVFKYI